MKLPEDEQKAYEHYKDDLHYQASMFESSFGDGYYEGKKKGKAEGKAEGEAEGKIEATRQMVLNLAKEKVSIETIMLGTNLTQEKIIFILEQDDEK